MGTQHHATVGIDINKRHSHDFKSMLMSLGKHFSNVGMMNCGTLISKYALSDLYYLVFLIMSVIWRRIFS